VEIHNKSTSLNKTITYLFIGSLLPGISFANTPENQNYYKKNERNEIEIVKDSLAKTNLKKRTTASTKKNIQSRNTPQLISENTNEVFLNTAINTARLNAVELSTIDVRGDSSILGSKNLQFKLPSSFNRIEQEELRGNHVMTTNEALRKVPGVVVRDEEGFGMRPNISIRGLNPTRSTKVMLLEDGIPLAYAPYGDNTSYYYPTVDRFSSIEVLKGAGQIKYGPQTIGGVINHITPTPPEKFGGFISYTGGNRDFLNTKLNVGGNGMLLDYTFKKGDGARDNTNHNIDDLNFKIIRDLTENQALTLRTNYFSEDSQVSYSGLTRAEYENFGGQYNPFKNDSFVTKRYGTSATHDWQVSQNMYLLTNIYYSYFDRDWWRQQSNSAARNIASGTGCDSIGSARVAGQRINSDDCLGNQGRLRTYETYGIEPSLNINHQLGLLELSMRIHREQQDRRQVNGSSPRARDGTLVEDNYRETNAISGYISNKFDLGKFSITPAVRYEHIENERLNRLNGANGRNILHAWVPGLSVGYTPNDQITYFAGVHKGFAPPRTEDLITNNGGAIDVNAENSTNHEIGFRAKPNSKSYIETTAFYNDFSNLIAVGSVASNLPALAQGEALFAGLEMLGKYDFDSGFYSKAAITWLPIAKQESQFRRVDDNTNVANSMEGKRQPYAPKQTITAGLGFRNNGWDGFFEAVHVGEQFADFAETKNVDDIGQNGVINSYTIFNAAVNYKLPQYKTSLFAVGKNIFDNEYIVDRTRGIITGMPALFQVGARIDF